jgi:undecaprenyl-diphosphatase
MFYIYSIILGIVQGLTEFLPVSSSGHLVILHNILNFKIEQNLAFDIALHLGTALALIIYFWQDIKKYLIVLFNYISRSKTVVKSEIDLVFKLIIATIPAVIAGLLLEEYLEKIFRNVWVVVVMLITISLLFFVVEKFTKKKKQIEQISFWQALFIGCAQVLALIPGVSRSGITICAGMGTSMTRKQSARFAFLIGIPIILGAGIYKIFKLDFTAFDNELTWLFVIGFLSSFISGYLVIKFLMKFLSNHKLNIFAWYRIGLALILALYLILK